MANRGDCEWGCVCVVGPERNSRRSSPFIRTLFPHVLPRTRTHSPPSSPPGSGAVVYAFSTTDRESFLAVENWKRKVDEECGDIPCVLVQNKIDMLAQAQVDPYVL